MTKTRNFVVSEATRSLLFKFIVILLSVRHTLAIKHLVKGMWSSGMVSLSRRRDLAHTHTLKSPMY